MATLYRGTQGMATMASDKRVRSVAKEILRVAEGEAELLMLMSGRAGSEFQNRGAQAKIVPVTSRKHEWQEKRLAANTVTIGTVGSATTFQLSQADNALLRVGHVLRLNNATAARVSAIDRTAGNSYVVTTAAAHGFAAGDTALIVGVAIADGAEFTEPYYNEPEIKSVYVQEVSDSYKVTRQALTETRYDGPIDTNNWDDVLFLHRKQLNRVLWFGKEESTDTVGGTGGIVSKITSNIGTFDNGIVTFRQLRDMVGDYTRKSPSPELDLYVAPDVWSLLDELFWQKVSINAPVVKEAGVSMRKITVGPKVLNVIQASCFEGYLANAMVAIDPKYFQILTTTVQDSGRKQWMLEYTEGPEQLGAGATKKTIITDIAAKLMAEEAHWMCLNALNVA